MPLNDVGWIREKPIAPGIIIGWPSTNASIPVGWTRETSLDARFVKCVVNASTNPGGTGGANNHDHPFPAHSHAGASHTHVGGDSGSTGGSNREQSGITQYSSTHSHTMNAVAATSNDSGNNSSPTNWDATTTDPANLVVIFIKSIGVYGFPASSIAFYNGAAPAGWTAYSNGTNRVWKGAAAAGDGGATGGTGDSHTHAASHTHPAGAGNHLHTTTTSSANGSSNEINAPPPTNSTITIGHNHSGDNYGTASPAYSGTGNPTSTTGDMTPPWKKLLTIENTSGGALLTTSIIALWTDTIAKIPGRWKICDGNNSTPNMLDKFVRGANGSGEVGNTGGAATHTHASGGSHTHTVANHSHGGGTTANIGNGSASVAQNFGGSLCNFSHTHSFPATSTDGSHTSAAQTVDATANSSNTPVYTDVAYIQVTF